MKKRISIQILFLIGIAMFMGSCQFFGRGTNYPQEPDGYTFPLTEKWSAQLDSEIFALSKSDSGSILLRTTGTLYALNSTGEVLWRFPLGKQIEPMPAVEFGGKVFVADDKTVWALDMDSGQLLWSQSLPEPGGWIADASEKIVLINVKASDMRAYDTQTGALLWDTPELQGRVYGYIDDSSVYIPDLDIVAYDELSGDVLWKEVTGLLRRATAYQNGILYFSANNGDLQSPIKINFFNVNERNIVAEAQIPISSLESISAEDNSLIIAGLNDFYVLSSSNYETLWNARLSRPVNPSKLGNYLYIMEGFNRIIYAFDIETGKVVGALQSGPRKIVYSDKIEMVSTNDLLLFADGDKVYAYGR
jgi:outer membrane protein assembly factor BamB